MEFVHGLGHNSEDAAVAEAIVQLAGALHLQVIAEGIETPTQLDTLRGLGCRFGQGYYFSKPLPAYELFRKNTRELPNQCQFVRLDLLPKKEGSERPSAARGVAQPG